ncbi:hypothetical protein GCM10010521_02840 [Streptomyces rameus]|uniref:Uncharacterized protein n=1 Tax=Streptomyces rameus TaxID=68261 RepID=A0ABP6MMU6_9ACTN
MVGHRPAPPAPAPWHSPGGPLYSPGDPPHSPGDSLPRHSDPLSGARLLALEALTTHDLYVARV